MTKITIEMDVHDGAGAVCGFWDWLCRRPCHRHNHEHHQFRLVPVLGLIREQTGPVPAPNCLGPYFKSQVLLMFKMSDSQVTVASFAFVDKRGNPVATPPAGTFQFGTDSPSILTLVQGTVAADGTFTPDPAGTACQVTATGPLGTASFSVKFVDGTGTTIAAGTEVIEIDAGNVATIKTTFAPATEQP